MLEDKDGPFLAQIVGIIALIVILLLGIVNGAHAFIPDALSMNVGGHPAKIPPDVVCVLFIILNIVRVWLGLNFLHSDTTFLTSVADLESDNPASAEAKRKYNKWLTRATFVVFTLFPVSVNNSVAEIVSIWALIAVFVAQSILLIALDLVWWRVLITDDIEKAANKFIVIGDLVVLAFTVGLTIFAVRTKLGSPVDPHWESGFFLAISGALVAIFLGELWSQYGTALVARCKEAFR